MQAAEQVLHNCTQPTRLHMSKHVVHTAMCATQLRSMGTFRKPVSDALALSAGACIPKPLCCQEVIALEAPDVYWIQRPLAFHCQSEG